MRLLALAFAALMAGCATPSAPPVDVLATFYPLGYVATQLAGDDLSVGVIVPAGVEPHDWEASPSDVARLGGARLVLAQGGGFDPWINGLAANLGERAPRVVTTTSTIQLADHDHEEDEEDHGHEGAEDPHTWLAPALLARQAEVVEGALAKDWPEHAAALRARGATLQRDLGAVHEEYEGGLATCEVRVIIANHDAYGYLARAYDFEVVALSGLAPEAEPTPDALARAIDAAREHDVRIIFFEELVSPRVAEIVADEVGASTRVLSPIESAPEQGDVLSLMRENLAGLREAMRCT